MPQSNKPADSSLNHFRQHGPGWKLLALFIEKLPAVLLAASGLGTTIVAAIYGPAVLRLLH